MFRLVNFISHASQPSSDTSLASVIIATAFANLATITISRLALGEKKVKIIKSPAATLLPNLSQAEKDALPYPPDAYPGGRDVDSPYGTIRVYEWGPEDGRKVLFVHGITTACLAIGAVAHGMTKRGCRVMLFVRLLHSLVFWIISNMVPDLWGRGYSDSCANLDHDKRLFSTQILLAITSSPLSWTSKSGFSLIGYSLGGGISAAFTSYFPNLVDSLVLLAPTGLIREDGVAVQKRLFFFASLIPNSVLEVLFKKRLQRPLFPEKNKDQSNLNRMIKSVAVAKAKVESEKIPAPVSLRYPDVTETIATQSRCLPS